MTPLVLAYDLTALATLIYAAVAGGWSERAAAVLNMAASVASALVAATLRHAFRHPEFGEALIDLSAAAGFFAIAVASRLFWPTWAFGFAVGGIASTAARLLVPDADPFVYYLSESTWPYAIMAVIMVGTAARTRTWMIWPAWRRSSRAAARRRMRPPSD